MYAYIRGNVEQVLADRAVVEAAGVGYELLCSGETLKRLTAGREARLYAHLYLAEGVMALYGFYDTAERDMFRRLIGVTRVGPKVALSVLSLLTPADVAAAVATQNAAAFARVPGMGKKTAERVLLELREKVAEAAPAAAEGAPAGGDIRAEAVAALVSLGYDGLSASRAVAALAQAESVEALITQALRSLARL